MQIKNKLTIIFLVFIMMILIIVPVFALIFHDTTIDGEVGFDKIPPDATNLTLSYSSNLMFKYPGDTIEIVLGLENNSTLDYEYYFNLELTEDYKGLEKAVFMYLNGKFCGTLFEIVSKSNLSKNKIEYKQFITGMINNEIDSIENVIKFELHNGAEESIFNKQNLAIKIIRHIKSVNVQENIFVNDFNTLIKAINDAENDNINTKNIILKRGIVLENDIVLNKAINIDLFGNNILQNGFNISLSSKMLSIENFNIYSSRKLVVLQESKENLGRIILSSDRVFLNIDASAVGYGTRVDINKFNLHYARNIIESQLFDKLINGLNGGESVDLFNENFFYIKNNHIKFESINSNYEYQNGIITADNVERTISSAYKINEKTIEFKIIGKNIDKVFNKIIIEELKHLQTNDTISYDLFLPIKIDAYNARIEWWSSNNDIINTDGVLSSDADGEVNLVAKIIINNEVRIKEFNFVVLKQSNEMRFEYLISKIGEKELNSIYNINNTLDGSYFYLPQVGGEFDYKNLTNNKNLGLEKIYYEIEPIYFYLGQEGLNKIYLLEPTFQGYAEVKIKGKFFNEDKIYEGNIGVKIKLGNSSDLHNKVAEYLQGLFNSVDVLKNILDTRLEFGYENEKGDFIMPIEYMGFKIEYYFINPNDLNDKNKYLNSADGITSINNNYFSIDLTKLKDSDSLVSLVVDISIKEQGDNNKTTSKNLTFSVPGAVHSDDLGIENEGMFYGIKLQILQQSVDFNNIMGFATNEIKTLFFTSGNFDLNKFGLDYILIYDIKYCKTLNFIYGDKEYNEVYKTSNINGGLAYFKETNIFGFNINNMNSKMIGLKHFTEINTLKIIGSLNGMFYIDSTQEGLINAENNSSKFLESVSLIFNKITHLEYQNCNLTTAVNIKAFKKIEYLNISENKKINNLNFINDLDSTILKYLDINGLNISLEYDLNILSNAFYLYKIKNYNESDLYYTDQSGKRARFSPSADMQEIDLLYLSYLFKLKDIEIVNSMFLQLPKSIVVRNPNGINETIELRWEPVSTDEKLFKIITTNNVIRLEKLGLGKTVLKVGVTSLSGKVITRYFKIKLE